MFISLAVIIDRADDRASLLFAAGALLVAVFLFSLVMMLMSIGVAAGITYVSGGRVPGMVGLVGTFALFLLFTLGLTLLDRTMGHKIAPESATGRRLSKALRLTLWLSPHESGRQFGFVPFGDDGSARHCDRMPVWSRRSLARGSSGDRESSASTVESLRWTSVRYLDGVLPQQRRHSRWTHTFDRRRSDYRSLREVVSAVSAPSA